MAASKKTSAKKISRAIPARSIVARPASRTSGGKAARKAAPVSRATHPRPSAKNPSAYYNESLESQSETGGRTVRVHKSTVIIAVIIVLLGVLLYYGRGLFVAAVVNGQPISRMSVIQATEKANGKQALTTLVRNTLVEQEAKKENVSVSDKEINDQIKLIENNLSKQGQKIDQMLAMEGLSRDDLHRIIRTDLLVTKMVGKDVKISDSQVNDYIDKNKDLLPKDKKPEELKTLVRDELKKEQLPLKAQTWLAALEKKANIVKFVDY